jgi:type III pantothenate kinase
MILTVGKSLSIVEFMGMKTLLAIDAGNSHVKYGHFRDGELVEFWRHGLHATEQECETHLKRIDAPVALASVAPTQGAMLISACKRLNKPVLEISAGAQQFLTGMDETMGADRVADAVAAWQYYGQGHRPVLVMGFGTATTLLAITSDGHVAGGWIAPGLAPTLEVLHDRCQLLPLLQMQDYSEAFGYDTDSHMRNGVFLGHVGLAKQWLESGRRDLAALGDKQNAVTVATGGWGQAVQDFAPIFDKVDRELTLRGVYIIAAAAFDKDAQAASALGHVKRSQ